MAIIGVVVVVGLAGFSVTFSDYFRRGATSAAARLDYWRAACRIAKTYPGFGTGPGTFSVPYKQLKTPEAEMTRLVHNNYLEQAADSGLVGFLTFCSFMFGSLAVLYRKTVAEPVPFCVWLGLLGWVLQGFVEFGLYIPALAWPAFLFFGWLWGVGPNGFDKPAVAQYPFGPR